MASQCVALAIDGSQSHCCVNKRFVEVDPISLCTLRQHTKNLKQSLSGDERNISYDVTEVLGSKNADSTSWAL